MPSLAWLDDLLSAVDRSDTDAFLSHLTSDACFTFGNAPPQNGTDAIRALLDGFFASIRHTRHAVHDRWGCGDAAIARGMVTYTRLDGSEYTVPFANIFVLVGGKIRDYRIYVDNHELYAGSEK